MVTARSRADQKDCLVRGFCAHGLCRRARKVPGPLGARCPTLGWKLICGYKRLRVRPAELDHGNMATNLVARLGAGIEAGLPLLADGSQFARAPRVKDAAARHMNGAGNLILQPQTLLDRAAQDR